VHGGPIDLAACLELCGAGFRATVTVTVRPMLRDRCPASLFVTLQVYCGQTVGRIKMPLGTEVVLGPGYIVLDGDPAPPRKWTQQPAALTFRRMSIVAKRPPISATAELLLRDSW